MQTYISTRVQANGNKPRGDASHHEKRTNLAHSQMLVVEFQQSLIPTLILLLDTRILQISPSKQAHNISPSIPPQVTPGKTYRADIHPWIWSLNVSMWLFTVKDSPKALTASASSSLDARMQTGIVKPFPSAGSIMAGCTSAAALKGVPSCEVNEMICPPKKPQSAKT